MQNIWIITNFSSICLSGREIDTKVKGLVFMVKSEYYLMKSQAKLGLMFLGLIQRKMLWILNNS